MATKKQLDDGTAANLLSSFYKAFLTLGLATIGGEIAILKGLFANSPWILIAYLSICFLIASCLTVLGAHESLVLRSCVSEDIGNPIAQCLLNITPKSEATEVLLRAATGLFYSVGLGCFAWFVIRSSWPW